VILRLSCLNGSVSVSRNYTVAINNKAREFYLRLITFYKIWTTYSGVSRDTTAVAFLTKPV